MGNDIYSDTLDDVEEQPVQEQPKNKYTAVLEQDDVARQVPLRQSLKKATTFDPDRAAKVQQLAGATGLPADVVDRNYEDLSQRQLTDRPYGQMQKQTPALAEWATKPENAAVAHDDMEQLGAIEWLLKAPSRAVTQTLNAQGYGALRTKSLFGDLTPDEVDLMNSYKLHMQDGGQLGTEGHWFRGAMTGGIKLATMLASTMPVYGLAGAVGGAVVGGVGGSILPGAGTLTGAVAGAKLGFEAGNLYGLGKMAFQTEAAASFDQYLDFKDDLGQPIDPKVARMAALGTGAINAALMTGGGALLKASIGPAAEKLGSVFVRDAVASALKVPSVRAALLDAAKTYGATLGEGTALMVGMRVVNILGGEIAKYAAEQGGRPDYGYGPRFETGEPKGLGYLGPLQRPDGTVMSEFSTGVNIDGKEVQIPAIVPTLSKDEISGLLTAREGEPLPASVIAKATAYAKERIAQGKSPFAGSGEQQALFPELQRAPVPAQKRPEFTHATPQEVYLQLLHAASEGAQSFAFAAGIGPALGFTHDVARSIRAKDAPAFFTALGEGVAQSKTAQRLPDAAREFIDQATKDGPIATVYAPIESWRQYWQSQGVDPASVAERVIGSRDAYENAVRSGEDLAIPTSRYATQIAATEHNAFFANELRLGPDEMNGREAAAFAEQIKTAQAPEEKLPSPVQQAVMDKLTEAGVPPDTAREYAALYESSIGNLAERSGVDPQQLFEQYGLKIDREGLPAEGAARAPEGVQGPADGQIRDEAGRVLGGTTTDFSGPERRVSGGEPYTGPERRNGQLEGSIAERAAAMRRENPNIDKQAAEMRARAANRKHPEVDKSQAAAQNPEQYFNVEGRRTAQEGNGPGHGEGERSNTDAGRTVEGTGDASRHEPGRLRSAPLPGPDEIFRRQPAAATAARLTPEVRRELDRIVDELEAFPYVDKTFTELERGAAGKGNAGHFDIVAGNPQTDTYKDIQTFSPYNEGKGKRKGQAAKHVEDNGQAILNAARTLLKTGDVHNNLAEGALRVAENRAAEDYMHLSPPSLPAKWGREIPEGFEEALSAAIDAGLNPSANLLDQDAFRNEDSIIEPDGPVDTSFNVDEFNQSLFDELEPPDPVVDTLTTGEEQPRLPGAGDVRNQNIATPEVAEAPFSLTSEVAKPRAGKNRTLFQTVYHGTPHVFEKFELRAIGTGEGNQSYGWGLYFTSTKEIADRYAEAVKDDSKIDDVNRRMSEIAHELDKYRIPGEYNKFNDPRGDELAAEYEKLYNTRADIIQQKGHVYTVEIPDDENMLDYDLPASQQPAKVQEALRALGVTWEAVKIPSTKQAMRSFNSDRVAQLAHSDIGIREALREGLYYAAQGNEAAFKIWYGKHQGLMRESGMIDPTGRDIYERVQMNENLANRKLTLQQSAEAASRKLNEVGVHGIRYMDGNSRIAGEGTHNYVVFDDKLAAIKEFSQAAPKELTDADVRTWADEVRERAGADLQVFNVSMTNAGDLKLNMFAVDRGAQRAGIGSRAMQELTRFADLNGKRIVLSPAAKDDAWGTSSRSRLVKFYKRFGFVENKGRNTDFAISDGMYREPTLPNARPETAAPVDDEGNTLTQEKRGAIRFGADRQVTIKLLERADLSTFLHETGHFFLEVMGDIADRLTQQDPSTLTDAQRAMLFDHGTLLQHFGVENRNEITTEHHESFARMFEAYLMEGKAPSLELQGTFSRFRAWLVGVYRSLTNLHVNLTDDVRGILDRMVASDRAIQDAESRRGIVAMFTAPEDAGMTPAEFGLYRKTVETASLAARAELDRKLFAEVQREQTAQWKAERQDVKTSVEAGFHSRPEYQAIAAMQRGTHPNGEPLIEGVTTDPLKLDAGVIAERFGPDRVKRLPRGIIAKEGGVDPDLVARMFGYNSGDAMLTAVEKAPPMRAAIEQEVKRQMFERNGNALLDGTLHEKAQAAVANEDRDLVIRAELRALGQLRRTVGPFVAEAEKAAGKERDYERRYLEAEAKLRIAIAEGYKQVEIDKLKADLADLKSKQRGGAATIRAAMPPADVLKAAADARINALRIGSIQPQAFWSASRRSAQMALDRAARGDYDGAIQAKQQELISVNLYRRAEAALEAVDAGVKFARSLTSTAARQRIGLAGGTYLDQIDGILDRFEFAKVADNVLERRASLRDWAESLVAQGMPADQLPEDLLQEANRKNYKDMTLEEFAGVTEGLRQIAHLAALKNRMLKAQDARDFAEVRDGVVASMLDNNERRPKKLEFTRNDERFQTIEGWFAAHRKISNIVQALDGYEDGGAFWTAFMKPINEAADTEAVRRIDAAGEYLDIIDKHYPGGEIRALQDKLDVPGVGALTKEARLALAMNWGNETSRARVLADPQRGWNREQVNAILDTLDKRDWEFVQSTFDFINKFWPEIAAKQERVTGIAPEKVEAAAIETKFGSYAGGYYPLQYDSRFSPRVAANELASKAKLETASAYVRTTTKRGHVEARKQNVKLPIRLDLSVVHNHIDQVLHDLTHHEMLIDVTRLLRDPKISKTIIETKGDRAYHALTTSLQDIALGSAGGPRNAMDKAATFMRSGVQIAQLGWNFWTAMQQPLGIFNAMARVGPGWIARGSYRWLRDAATMNNTVAWINEVSPMMRERAMNATQDLSDLRTAFREPGGWFDGIVRKVSADNLTVQTITDSMLWHIGLAQRVADVPTWLGQYEKSMAGGETEERAFRIADQAVLDSHGHGAIKDLAQVQRGGPVARLFMTFYSYGNTVFNATAREFDQVQRTPASVGRFLGHLGLLYVAPAMATVAMQDLLGKKATKQFFADVARESASVALNTMVFVRELGALAQEGNRGYGGPAGTRFFQTLDALGTQIKQGKADEALGRALLDVGGVLMHFPSTQIERTIDGWVALEEGRTKNPAALIVGPPPKNLPK